MPRFELAPIHWLNDLRNPYQSAKENGNMSRHFKKLIFTLTVSHDDHPSPFLENQFNILFEKESLLSNKV